MSQIGADTFIRSNQSGWGTASDGQTWSQIDGTDTLAISSNEGTATGKVNTNSMQLGTKTAKDIEGLVRVSVSATNARAGIELRVADANTYYACRLNGSTNQLDLCKQVSGLTSVIVSGSFTVAASTFYWIRFRAQGTTIEGKIWQDGNSEPGSWTVSTTDSTYTSAGGFGLYTSVAATSTVVKFDHFTATNLQDTSDIMLRARLANHQDTFDIMMRTRLAGPVLKDIMARARLANPPPVLKDIMARARLAGFDELDILMRACLAEQVNALPALAASLLTVTISGKAYDVLEGSFAYTEAISGRSTCTFTVEDATGTVHFAFRQQVRVTHSVRGEIFRGYINSAQETNLPPNAANQIQVGCIDEHWIADKRPFEGNEFANQFAGDIAAFLASQLAADGITAAYAIDHDTTITDFAEGTLSGVVAAASVGSTLSGDGDLELAPAGNTVTISEQSFTDFGQGTLTNVQANGMGTLGTGSLSLLSVVALKMTGTASIPGGGNLYAYEKIWAGNVAIASGYTLQYDVWVASTSPQIQAGVDLIMTDGTAMRDVGGQACVDQQSLKAHPGTDLSGFANDQWYTRTISLTPLAGKTTAYASIAFEGNNVGLYTAYFRNITIFDNSGNGVGLIFAPFPGTLNINPAQPLSNNGYTGVSVSIVTSYQQSGTRTSPNYALTAAGIARTSLISWQQTIPTDPNAKSSGASYSLTVSASLDGGNTWQVCTSGQPIPGLMPGLNLTGQTLTFKETLSNTTTDPTQTPALTLLQATVQPSYASVKQDVKTVTATQTDWLAGSFTGTALFNGGLTINGYTRTWDSASTTGQTLYGANTPSMFVSSRQLVLRSGNNTDVRARMDFAGQWQNFTAEVDLLVGTVVNTSQNTGIVYRTTGWQNGNDTYAYSAYVNQTQIVLATGTNSSSGSGTFTALSTVALTLASGNMHRLKVVVNGNNHQVYLDDVLYININDSTYTGAGYLGLRLYNAVGNMVLTSPGLTAGTNYTTITVNYINAAITNATLLTLEPGTANQETVYAYGPQAAATGVTAIQITTNSLGNGAAQAAFTPAHNHATGALFTFPFPATMNFNSFGVASGTSLVRVSPNIDLSGAIVAQDSAISWTTTTPGSSTVLVEASIDGGNTYYTCTSGQPLGVAPVVPATNPPTNTLPLVPQGTNLSGVKALIRTTLSTTSVTTLPTISDLTLWVVGQLSSSGSRVSLPLALAPVGRIGDSLVAWDVLLPSTRTTFGIDVSQDGVNWTDVTNLNGQSIPLLSGMQDPPFVDTFSTDNSPLYSQGHITTPGGTSAIWSVATTLSEVVVTGGIHAFFGPISEMLFAGTAPFLGDGEIYFDSDRCDNGGLVWCLSADFGTCYELIVQDSAGIRSQNQMRLYKVQNGTFTQLGLGTALSFTRGIPTRFKVVQSKGTITVTTSYPVTTIDGAVVAGNTQTLTYTDPSPLAPGGVGLLSNGGTNHYSMFSIKAYGQDATNQSLFTRVRLGSTDPTITPQVQDMTVSVHGQTISDGALIPTTAYSTLSGSKNTIAQDLDDLARQSNGYWWRILQGVLYFQAQTGTLAPFPITNTDMLIPAKITVTYDSSLYRNESIIIGGTDVVARAETYLATGLATNFPTGDPIDSVISILVNGQAQTFGLQGVDTGKQWYYQQGKQGIIQDASALPLPNGTQVTIAYEGQIQVIAKAQATGQIALMASLDGTSGIVSVTEDGSGLNSAGAQALAQARIQQYATFAITLQFATCRPGLHIGQLLTVTLPQHGLLDVTFLITTINYGTAATTINGLLTLLETFTVTATSGPIVHQWTDMFSI